ncbi:unnamed protein product, partial [Ixodes hexagonus]
VFQTEPADAVWKSPECTESGNLSSSQEPLEQRQEVDQEKSRLDCLLCPFPTVSKCSFARHEREHGERRQIFSCNVCQKEFTCKTHLHAHKSAHGNFKLFQCPTCPKVCRSRNRLTVHQRTHTGERPFECPICSKAFRAKADLSNYASIHTGEKPYKCSICPKTFRMKYGLTHHYMIHTDGKPFKCSICLKSFRNKCSLTSHSMTHTDATHVVKTIPLPHPKLYRSRDRLTVHERTRTGERSFKCPICPKAF